MVGNRPVSSIGGQPMSDIQMVFENPGAISDADICAVTMAMEDVGKGSLGALSALANVLLDTLLVPELDRRCDGGESRPRTVELRNVKLSFREARLAMHFAIEARDHLLRAGRPE